MDINYNNQLDEEFFEILHQNLDYKELEVEYGATLPKKLLRDHSNPLELRMEEFTKVHGMSKQAFRHFLSLTEGQLDGKREDNPTTLPPVIKLSAFLQFLRSGSFQRCIGSNKALQISQPSACNAINFVAKIFANLLPNFVQFPDMEERKVIAYELGQIAGFPPVVCGVIDGCHVEIAKPSTLNPLPERFFNRKGYYRQVDINSYI